MQANCSAPTTHHRLLSHHLRHYRRVALATKKPFAKMESNRPIELKLGTERFSRVRNPNLDTILTSEVFGTIRPSPFFDLFTESSDRAETWHPAVFEGGESKSTILTSEVFGITGP